MLTIFSTDKVILNLLATLSISLVLSAIIGVLIYRFFLKMKSDISMSDFISSSITEVLTGVEKARRFHEKNGNVNPLILTKRGWPYSTTVNKIEFDLLVKFSQEDSLSGKIVVVNNITGLFSTKKIKGTENRVKFSIPITMPGSKTPGMEIEEKLIIPIYLDTEQTDNDLPSAYKKKMN